MTQPEGIEGVLTTNQKKSSNPKQTGNKATMTILFRRIKPAQKFCITKRQLAKFLQISESLIVKIESWSYVLFVHRKDQGGQFISYRQLEQWKNAVACQLQKCTTRKQLEHLWNAIIFDHTKHNKQYADSILPFLEKIYLKCQVTISKDSPSYSPFSLTNPDASVPGLSMTGFGHQ